MNCKKCGKFTAICSVFGSYGGNFTVRLFDSRRKLIAEKRTGASDRAYFAIERSGEYSVCVSADGLSPKGICSWISLDAGKDCSKDFIFSNIEFQKPLIDVKITLTDKNYSGFPISEGVISIWRQ